MSKQSAVAEQQQLQTVERRYRRKGYKVVLHPRGNDLPTFLARFQPDMIAYNDHERVVVEAKSRTDLPTSGYMLEMADAINAQEGWRFDLAVVNPRASSLVDEDLEPLGQTDIAARVRAVRHLLMEQQDDAAILLAWSTLEGALRLIAERENIRLEGDQPAAMIRELYSLGILGPENYEVLQKGLRARNILVHGFRLPDAESGLAATLLGQVEELLQTSARQSYG